MMSARMKAEQAQEIARKAAADAEIAMSTARQYSPAISQPGALWLPDTLWLLHTNGPICTFLCMLDTFWIILADVDS